MVTRVLRKNHVQYPVSIEAIQMLAQVPDTSASFLSILLLYRQEVLQGRRPPLPYLLVGYDFIDPFDHAQVVCILHAF